MKIEAVDFFYLAMPQIHDVGDGSQDALLVRVQAGGYTGWGECEAAPLVSLASWSCPMSHSACKPVRAAVLGQRIDSIADIHRVNATVREDCMDLLQADHTLSGIDIALWDLLGKKTGRPVHQMLGYDRAYPKTTYASQLFGDAPEVTCRLAREVRREGYRAAKFGWGPFGRGSVREDAEQVHAAREGLGPDGLLMVDAGTVFDDDVEQARLRLPDLEACGVLWLEEPFVSGAVDAYRALARHGYHTRLAGGEGCHNFYQAKGMVDHAALGYLQIDAGRIGGITTAKQVADYARRHDVCFVNHTFTTHLALCASLAPYAGIESDHLCEYPVKPTRFARNLTRTKLLPNDQGQIHVPAAPGLGVEPDPDVIREYLVDVEIRVGGEVIYQTAEI